MLEFFTILMMLIVAWAHHREGLFTAVTMLVNIFLAGIFTFQFWEPLADLLDGVLRGGFVQGFEDFFVMIFLFASSLGALRWCTDNLANNVFELPPNLHRFGGAALGLFSGYLLAGFFLTALETLPWHENFMSYTSRTTQESAARRYLPPDRIWRAIMRHAGANSLCRDNVDPLADSNYDRYRTFDRDATFEIRYTRYRRYGTVDNKDRPPLPYQGEFDQELYRKN